MNTNRYEKTKRRLVPSKDFLGVGPAWWGATMVATICFVWAIAWLLTNPIG